MNRGDRLYSVFGLSASSSSKVPYSDDGLLPADPYTEGEVWLLPKGAAGGQRPRSSGGK